MAAEPSTSPPHPCYAHWSSTWTVWGIVGFIYPAFTAPPLLLRRKKNKKKGRKERRNAGWAFVYTAVMITPKANYDLGHTQQLEEIVLFSEKDDKWIEESSHVPLGERALFAMQGGGGVCRHGCSVVIITHFLMIALH